MDFLGAFNPRPTAGGREGRGLPTPKGSVCACLLLPPPPLCAASGELAPSYGEDPGRARGPLCNA